MRALGLAAALALTLVAGSAAAADEPPSHEQVREAREAVQAQERDVAGVQAALVLANQRLQQSATRAAQAAEAWNGARYRLQQARSALAAAEDRSAIAVADVERQQDTYADALATSYAMAPELTALGAIAGSEGIAGVVDRTTLLQSATSALDSRYDAFRAAATLADVATQQAEDARTEAAALQAEARTARDRARAAADAAAAEATAIAQEKDALIAELAGLQDISTSLAEQRQAALEQAAAEAAAEAAAQEAEDQAAQEEQEQPAPQQQPEAPQPQPQPQPDPQPQPQEPQPDPQPAPPAPASGASAAVAFARAQIGEPYRWGAAGPGAWDCSGLTMGAWGAGGKSLPHYSVAQYEQASPISAGSLRAGDLVFWGSSSSPSSIYHVALYVGGGQIVHAPRTGRPVVEESMYYWTTPNFYGRP